MHVSPYGGTWYPDCRTDLERLLDDLFESSRQRTGEYLLPDPLGFVVPHAAPQYSGTVAAAAFRHIQRQAPERVVILGFAHRDGPAGISVPDVDGYETPLGETEVDRATMERLAVQRPFQFVEENRICDHSVEIQLPMLQRAAPRARVVPLFVGHLNSLERDRAAEMLAGLCDLKTIFLVSSDLTHFGRAFGYQPFPVDSKVSARLEHLDRNLMDAAASLDPQLFQETLDQSRSTLCGRSPIGLWLRTLSFVAGDEIYQEILDYQTSGDVTGDYDHTVSYGAMGYFPVRSFWLDAAGRKLLLESARETLRHLRATGEHRPIPPREMLPALTRKAGVFVSLHQNGQLLGCMGSRTSNESLAEAVPEITLRAGLDDPRFPTVLGVEGEIDIEISILSPMKPIRDARGFRIGQHGAILESAGRAALLLPQVALRRDWDSDRFLSALSIKAGLGSKAYQNTDARLSVFQAQIITRQD
ncbi:MAG TPA: AmmeMemoRadiSam system protein B [Bryobacteraceae bacterium]|nr:AmmeMemoRadiSam system protein B [Bryobacteraceae bacterium]